MSEGRQRDDWGRTSSLMALIANCHRDKKKRRAAFKPAEFNPFEQSRPLPKVSIKELKHLFIKEDAKT